MKAMTAARNPGAKHLAPPKRPRLVSNLPGRYGGGNYRPEDFRRRAFVHSSQNCVSVRNGRRGCYRPDRLIHLPLRFELATFDGLNQGTRRRLRSDAKFIAQQIGKQFGVAQRCTTSLVSRDEFQERALPVLARRLKHDQPLSRRKRGHAVVARISIPTESSRAQPPPPRQVYAPRAHARSRSLRCQERGPRKNGPRRKFCRLRQCGRIRAFSAATTNSRASTESKRLSRLTASRSTTRISDAADKS